MSKCFKLLPALVLLLCFAESAFAQGSFFTGNAWRYTPAGISAASTATVTICTSAGAGAPCTPTITVYKDVALLNAVTNPLPVCGTPAPQFGCIDGLGNFSFYAATPGPYTYTITGAGLTAYGPIPLYSSLSPSANVNFTGTINCTIFNAVRCVSPSNPQLWAGSDVTGWQNSAYANCSTATLISCPIQTADGGYPTAATLLNFSTLGVFPYLQCPPGGGVATTFSATSGTAITLNPGKAGLPTDWGITGCKFIGSGLGNTLTGILSGGTNGGVGAGLRGIQLSGFNIGLTFGTNVQGWQLDHSVIVDNNQNLVVPANLSQTGEGMIFSNNTFGNTTAVWNPNCISIGNSSGTFYNFQFMGGSIDQCGVSIGNGSHTVFNQVHWENPQSVAMSAAYATFSGGVGTVIGNLMASEQAAGPGFNPGCSVVASCFIDTKSGASVTLVGNEALNNGLGAMSGFVHICATCTGVAVGNVTNFGAQTLPQESVDTGGQFARLSPNGLTLYGGNNSTGSTFFANTGQTISGVTGTLFGCLQPGVAHLCEFDTSGNLGMLGDLASVNLRLGTSGVIKNQAATATMGLTLKTGSGGGNYTGTNTTYPVAGAVLDSTNLCLVVTIPTGWKLMVSASGSMEVVTAAVAVNVSLSDLGTTCSTTGAAALAGSERSFTPPAAGTFDVGFHTQAIITGNGAAHAIALQALTSNAADAWGIQNTSAAIAPSMTFTLMPSN